MKTRKVIATTVTAVAAILMTGGFALAQSIAMTTGGFPFFQLGCLILGGMLLVGMKQKYERLFTSEAIGVFALYTIMISLFTNPVIEAVKTLVS